MKLNVSWYLYFATRGLARAWMRLTSPRLSRELLRPGQIEEPTPRRLAAPPDWNLSAREKRAKLRWRRRMRW